MAAVLPSGRKALPSCSNSASYFPGPQAVSAFFNSASPMPSRSVSGFRLGARVMILPMSRSRFGQPSSRWPMPGAKASSTVEWQMAQVMPTDWTVPSFVQEALDAHDRIQLEQGDRGGRVVEIDFLLFHLLDEVRGKRVHIDLQADFQRGFRTQPGTDAAELLAGDGLVQLEAHRPRTLRRRRCRSGRFVSLLRSSAQHSHPGLTPH